MKTLVICSGGLDSITLAHKVAKERDLSSLLTLDYAQRHKKEIHYAEQCAKTLGVPHHCIDISHVGTMLSGSALTDDIEVPDGHYAQDTMKATIVPNRNAIMLTIGYGVAAAAGDAAVAAAIHAGDHFIYPDCRPEFAQSFELMQNQALEGFASIQLYTPFIHQSKADIAREAAKLGLDIKQTWSCYKGGDIHCGRCGTCVERQEALSLANVPDPTPYADAEFWKQSTPSQNVKTGAV